MGIGMSAYRHKTALNHLLNVVPLEWCTAACEHLLPFDIPCREIKRERDLALAEQRKGVDAAMGAGALESADVRIQFEREEDSTAELIRSKMRIQGRSL